MHDGSVSVFGRLLLFLRPDLLLLALRERRRQLVVAVDVGGRPDGRLAAAASGAAVSGPVRLGQFGQVDART